MKNYSQQLYMGLTQNRIENFQSPPNPQDQPPATRDPQGSEIVKEDVVQVIDEHGFQTAPIFIPQFYIKVSPFTLFTRQEPMEGPIDSQELKPIQKEEKELSCIQKSGVSLVGNRSWLEVVYHSALFGKILQYLSPENDHNLMLVNHRIYSELFLHRLLIRDNNWLSPLTHIKSKPEFEEIYWKLSQYEEESQHSLDLDRTESFFCSDTSDIVDKTCQVAKLDRIMKALTASSVPYSQGINSVVAKLLSFFEEETAYWVVIFLLKKTKNIHNDIEIYQQFMADVEQIISQSLPKLYKKLDDLDFNIEYFAMKWVMSMFAYDFNRETLFYLWDIFLTFDGLSAMKMFVLAIFEELQAEILKESYNRDEVNTLMKHKLKETVSAEMSKRMLKRTRTHLVSNKYGEDFLKFYDLSNQASNALNVGYQLQSARKYSRNSDDTNFIHLLLESPKEDKSNMQIQEEPQELQQSNNCQNLDNRYPTIEQSDEKDHQEQQGQEQNSCQEEPLQQNEREREKLLSYLDNEIGHACEKTTLTFD